MRPQNRTAPGAFELDGAPLESVPPNARFLRRPGIYLTYLRACAFEIFRKCGFKDRLMCLVGFCGVHSQAAVGCAIKG